MPARPPKPKKVITTPELDALLAPRGKRSAKHEAEDLYFEALEAATPAAQKKKLLCVLELDPQHTDTRLILLQSAKLAPSEHLVLLRDIVACERKRLGARAFKDFAGHFWGHLETRPYMRARYALARALRLQYHDAEAAAEFSEMITLCPNDNLGVRYDLLALLLAAARTAEAATLIKTYKDDVGVVFAWSRPLLAHLTGDLAAATTALAAARKLNPHAEAYLTGQLKSPAELADGYTFGSPEEAALYAESLLDAWHPHPAARAWLRSA